jgi:hypothetical protein
MSDQPIPAVSTTGPATGQDLTVFGRGIYRDLPSLMEAFQKAQEKFNVCFPVMRPDLIPPMHAVALRPVAIDVRLDRSGKPLSGDLYLDRGKYGLTKIALDKIAAAANLSWHPAYTGRVDDESEPLFRRYRACGVVHGLDGTPRLLTAHRSIDLRVTEWGMRPGRNQGSEEKYVAAGSKDALGMSEAQWREAQKFIDEMCESKAMNRVVRQYAHIKGRYEAAELAKTFVIAALVFTGETEDPDLKRELARAMVQKATNASAALFGPGPGSTEIADPGARTRPPALGVTTDPDEDDDDPTAGQGGTGGTPGTTTELF